MRATCAICGAPNAPFGFRPPGLRSELPERLRAYLWTCEKAECREAAEARAQAAMLGARAPQKVEAV